MSKSKNPAILNAAVNLAEMYGYREITREMIAKKANVGLGTVNLHMGTMHHLRSTIIRHAVRTNNKAIIAQAIIAKEPYIKRLTEQERKDALMTVA
jgi:AcrR family transcriptional regulator